MSLDAHTPAPSPLRALAFLAGLALVACSSAPTPLPNLPPPEYEPGRSVDLTPKAAPAPSPAAPAPPAPSAAPPGAPSSPPPPKG